ncbi:hypothetical protein STENM223S_04877 [Streptomyces tendae]
MTRTRTTRLRRPLLAGTTAVAAMAVTAGLVAATTEPAKAATGPELSLIAATGSLTLTSWKEDPGVYLDLGTYLTADGRPLELKVTRKSYKDPVTVTQTVYEGGKAKAKTLPKGTVKDFSGLPGFAEITVTDKTGKKVLSRTEDFCPNNASGRVRPDAPATSKYPESCPTNPFTLGSVWGVEKGWAANTYAGSYTEPCQCRHARQRSQPARPARGHFRPLCPALTRGRAEASERHPQYLLPQWTRGVGGWIRPSGILEAGRRRPC